MTNEAHERPQVARDYATLSTLTPAEVAALAEVESCVRGDVLDIGVGGGRTTACLSGAARSYRAVDISMAMVEACRARFPGVAIEIGDARTLSGHADNSYDLVLFSYNGIDYVEFDERTRVLAAAHRVMRRGAAFVYSSHNSRVLHGEFPPVSLQRVAPSINPLRLGLRTLRAAATNLRCLRNRRRLGASQHFGDGYALVNDDAYDHALLTVYVDPVREIAALASAGFTDITTFDLQGRRNPREPDDPWVYYVARKAG